MTTAPLASSTDPECPGAPHKHRRCLDCCLVISLVALTMAAGSLCLMYFMWEKPSLMGQLRQDIQSSGSPMHLVARHEHLGNMTLEWDIEDGSELEKYNAGHNSKEFKVGRTGLYYIYSQVVLSCVDLDECKESGSLSISVLKNGNMDSPLLKLSVQISESAKNTFPSSFSGRLKHLSKGDRLSSHLRVDHELSGWKLDNKENNFLGLFRVSDGKSSHRW